MNSGDRTGDFAMFAGLRFALVAFILVSSGFSAPPSLGAGADETSILPLAHASSAPIGDEAGSGAGREAGEPAGAGRAVELPSEALFLNPPKEDRVMPIIMDKVDNATMDRLDSLGVGGLVVNPWNWNATGMQRAKDKNWTLWANDYYMYPSGNANKLGGVQDRFWNPSFEEHRLGIWPDGWVWSYYGWPMYSLDGSRSRSGQAAVAADDRNCFFWSLGVEQGWEYEFSAWARASGMNEPGRLIIAWYDIDSFMSFNFTVFPTGPSWQQFSVRGRAPPGASVAKLMLQGNEQGKFVWFDDAMVHVVDPPPQNLVANRGFETDADANGIPDDWNPSSLPFYDVNGTHAHRGSCAVKVNSTNAYYQVYGPVTPGTDYYLGEWLRSDTGMAPGEIAVAWYNVQAQQYVDVAVSIFPLDTTYSYHDLSARAPPRADYALIILVSAGVQWIWADDIVFSENTLNNGVPRGPVLDGHPELEQQGLYYAYEDVPAPAQSSLPVPRGKLVSAVAAPVQMDGSLNLNSSVNVAQFMTNGRIAWTAPSGTWRVMAFSVDILFQGTEVDPAICNMHQINVMNKVAVSRFIEEMYEKTIRDNNSQFMGSLIRASFTDEVSNLAGYFLSGMRWPVVAWLADDVNGLYLTDTFKQLHGYDLMPLLPALWNDVGGRTAKYRIDFYNTTGFLQGEAYYGMIGDWCGKNGINFSGHPLCEDSLLQQVAFYGDFFESVKRMGYPGMDTLLHQAGNLETDLTVPKLVSSVALLYGKEHVMTEYSVSANDLNYRNMTAVANWQAVQGVDTVTSFSFSMGAVPDGDLRKHSEHVGRTNYMLRQGDYTADIVVLYPTTTMQAAYIPRNDTIWNMGAFSGYPLEQSFRKMTTSLLSGQLDFVYANDESLGRMSLNRATGAATLRHDVAGQDFRVLVLPEMDYIRTSSLEIVKAFFDAGGIVLAVGKLPVGSAENGTDPYIQQLLGEIFDMSAPGPNGFTTRAGSNGGRSLRGSGNFDQLREQLRSACRPDIVIASPGDANIYYTMRTAPGFDTYLIVNNGPSISVRSYSFRSLGEMSLWNPEDGTITQVKATRYSYENGYTVYDDLIIGGFSSVFVVFGKPVLQVSPEDITFTPSAPVLGDSVTIGVDARNTGAGLARQVVLTVYEDTANRTELARSLPQDIAAGGAAHAEFQWSATSPGNRTITIAATLLDGTSASASETVFVNTPPVAIIEANRTEALTLESIAFNSSSSDADGPLANITWDFGDGSTAEGVSAEHAYSDDGNYSVMLTVKDALGATGSASLTVNVMNRAPLANITVLPGTSGNATTDFSFNASGSFDRDGVMADFRWEFGDGESGNGTAPTHRYRRPGNYSVTLSVADDDGATDTSGLNLTIENLAPTASFTVSPAGGNISTRFTFASTAADIDGTLTEWNWSFGDGTFGSVASAQHIFLNDDTYNITLKVKDDLGGWSAPYTVTLKVANLPPTARISSDRTTLKVGQRLRLGAEMTADADDPLSALTYEWSFGDRSRNATGMFANHSFSKAGRFEVTLTVKDDDGEISMAWLQVTVEEQGTTTEGAAMAAIIGVGIIAMAALILAAMLLLRRRKDGTLPEGAEKGPDAAEPGMAPKGDRGSPRDETAPSAGTGDAPAGKTDGPEGAQHSEEGAGAKAPEADPPRVPPPE